MGNLSILILAILAVAAHAKNAANPGVEQDEQSHFAFDQSLNQEKRGYGHLPPSYPFQGKGDNYGGHLGSYSFQGKGDNYGGHLGSYSFQGKGDRHGGHLGSYSFKGKGRFKYGGRKGTKSPKGKGFKYGGHSGKGRGSYGRHKGKGRHQGVQGMGGFTTNFNCVKYPCMNGGVCCGYGRYKRCICPAGFVGKKCQIDVNECAGNPCKAGAVCFDQVNGYSCRYPDSIILCQNRQTACAPHNPCRNRGRCKSYKRSYQCVCRKGYAGRNCEIDIDECGTNPCLNDGKCVNRPGYYICICPKAYKGKNCDEKKRGGCSYKNVCKNGGTCVEENGSWDCICAKGFSGQRCERVIRDCSRSPCLNGGTCCERTGGYICKCAEGYFGTRCQKKDVDLYVPEGQGQLTFQEDGNDNPRSKRFSRKCRYKGLKDGIVIGRGYSLRGKSRKEVLRDLRKAGFPRRYALMFSRGAGLTGTKAIKCFKKYGFAKYRITKKQQKKLFLIFYRQKTLKAKKYLATYCKLKLERMSKFLKDLIVDFYIDGSISYASPQKRKRSDYIKKILESNDLRKIKALLGNRKFWIQGVKTSPSKFEKRRKFCKKECKKTRKC